MLDTLAHRGPDGRGVESLNDGKVLLGHRRLAIIDLSLAGAQPMCNEDGTVWLTFNGEIYNYRDLRLQLLDRGHTFRSQTDSEVIVHAYEEWGIDCVMRFNGIFAFGLWDGRTQDLLLARDPLGVKPLYYARYAGRFTFASQPKAIVTDPAFRREIDPQGLRDFLAFGYIPHERSAFVGMARLPAGHTATLKGDSIELRRYWKLECGSEIGDPREALQELREGITDAVRSQLISDVPVGCFLSGGIDSSLLVALARPRLPSLRSFTVGFEEADSDEREHAHIVAEHFGTRHFESVAREGNLRQKLCELQEFFDEPFDPNGPIPFIEVARLARQNGTVVALGGDGADEMFAGYLRYDDFDRPDWIPTGRPANLWRWLRRIGLLDPRNSAPADVPRYFRYEGCLETAGLHSLLDARVLDRTEDGAKTAMQRFYRPDLPAVAAAQYMDMQLYLVDHILCKVDRASMAYGVEVRVPYLDPKLVKLAFNIPLRLHYRNGERKALLKQVAANFLPPRVITQRKKGFSSPMDKWFNTRIDPWVRGWMDDGVLVQSGVLRPDWQQSLPALRAQQPAVGMRARWLLLTAELWARRWIAGDAISASVQGRH